MTVSYRRRVVFVSCLLALSTACGGSNATGPTLTNIVGTYTVTNVNGFSIPYTLPNPPREVIEFTGGQLAIRADHTYTLTVGPNWPGASSCPLCAVAESGTWTFGGTSPTGWIDLTSGTGPYVVWEGNYNTDAISMPGGAQHYRFDFVRQ